MSPARALLFPGQGSQAPGMGAEMAATFPAARAVWEEVDDALSDHLSQIAFHGPPETLTRTENAQPALLACSMAVTAVLTGNSGPVPRDLAHRVAGHSLGEYSALAAAGSFDLADAVRLVRLRGLAMQEAVPAGEGAMVALIGADLDTARTLVDTAREEAVLAIANDNAPGQVVVSGDREATERVRAIAADHGVSRAIPLDVSAPFHCPLMQPAADRMEEALGTVELRAPSVPLMANVTAEAVTEPATIRNLLVQQVTAMVRWRETILALRDAGIETLVEMGHGRVLAGLARRIDRSFTIYPTATPSDLDALAL